MLNCYLLVAQWKQLREEGKRLKPKEDLEDGVYFDFIDREAKAKRLEEFKLVSEKLKKATEDKLLLGRKIARLTSAVSSPWKGVEDLSLKLPEDCWLLILSMVDIATLAAFGATSKNNLAISKTWFLWQKCFLKDFGFDYWRGKPKEESPDQRRNKWLTSLYRPDRDIHNYHDIRATIFDFPDLHPPPHQQHDQKAFQVPWRNLFLRNCEMEITWKIGESPGKKQSRILVTGPRGSGKKTLLIALRHYFVKKGKRLTIEEIQKWTFKKKE